MAFPDRRTLNVLMTALLFGLVLAIVYVARAVIVIFAFSILFAYLINPIVRFLQRHSLFFRNLSILCFSEISEGRMSPKPIWRCSFFLGSLFTAWHRNWYPARGGSYGNPRRSWKTSIRVISLCPRGNGTAGMRPSRNAQKPSFNNAARQSAVWWNL